MMADVDWRFAQHIQHYNVPSQTTTPRIQLTPRDRPGPGHDTMAPAVVESHPNAEAAGGVLANSSIPQAELEAEFSEDIVHSFSSSSSMELSFAATASRYADTIATVSCLALDQSASLLAVGDITGRVVLYARSGSPHADGLSLLNDSRASSDRDSPKANNSTMPCDWSVWQRHHAFQAEFDCLKSVHIDERVTALQFLPRRSLSFEHYLASNERGAKLFRVKTGSAGLGGKKRTCVPLTAYTGTHSFAVHSLSVCSDEETFLSCDDLQIWLWHLEKGSRGICVMDIKPPSMDDVEELLTSASFHPSHGSLFCCCSSKGKVNIVDLRDPYSQQRRVAQSFVVPEKMRHGGEHGDILASVSDAKFVGERGKYLVSREYVGMRLWDTRNPSAPVESLSVHPALNDKLDELYNADAIFDKFTLAHGGDWACTGSYGGKFVLWNTSSACGGNLPFGMEHDTDAAAHSHPVNEPCSADLATFVADPDAGSISHHEVPFALPDPPDGNGPPAKQDCPFIDRRVNCVAVGSHSDGDMTTCSVAVQDHVFVFNHAVSRSADSSK